MNVLFSEAEVHETFKLNEMIEVEGKVKCKNVVVKVHMRAFFVSLERVASA